MAKLAPLHRGERSDEVRALQAATNRRLRSRSLAGYIVKEDGELGARTLLAVRKAAWALGALRGTLEDLQGTGTVSVGVQAMIRNPGKRNARQEDLGRKRVADMRRRRKSRAAEAAKAGVKRQRIVSLAKRAAANYRQQPAAYHYKAGGVANTTFLSPTPPTWRSDCSQFAASVYKAAGLPSPGDVDYPWVNTWAIDRKGRVTTHPRPGDLGLYGSKGNPHHVEVYIGEPGCMFVGHGSPPIDSVTPGLPSYYVTFDFLDD